MTTRQRKAPRRLDWEAARQKLAAVDETPELLRSRSDRALRERAVQLAAPLVAEAERRGFLEVISFRRAERRYAIESRYVMEVGKCGVLSRVPGAQPAMLGMTNLRGDLLPVFDLSHGSAPAEQAQLLVLGEVAPDFGLLVDAAEDVSRLALDALTAPSALGAIPMSNHARGVEVDGRVLLDGRALLLDRFVFVAVPSAGGQSEREAT